MIALKKILHAKCVDFVTQSIAQSQAAIDAARASANEETKSSAGDKYETGRAMMQLEIEKNTIQLSEAMKLKQVLDQINPERNYDHVQQGSLIKTDSGTFYLSIGVGQLHHDGNVYYAVSQASPIGSKMANLKVGESFLLNDKSYQIEAIS